MITLLLLSPGPTKMRIVDGSNSRSQICPETLMRSRLLSCPLIEYKPAQIFHESRREFSLVWPTLDDSR